MILTLLRALNMDRVMMEHTFTRGVLPVPELEPHWAALKRPIADDFNWVPQDNRFIALRVTCQQRRPPTVRTTEVGFRNRGNST